ncbi:class III poly(R)-hydroxyalkanoic acid synthase subunit PhaE [Cognatiluteimonas weifangensis]|uniref:Poly(3-hydroxyalkanoate) polymerase subunit PhaE n=1 Tax=Cognatiluteimonas weifangensis TaxID=2303539 RepID=A0A372DKL1_9GAMM|nr:class III poly(R)-hydroxyalkanoic acid synthase subunit PhaE [Luteimonas weifangensis]RFP60083.1 class III poly(R)-hydroxyalkanoic acid synthase subunit PhaE [Luteimonas weifangensis]
MANTQGPGDFEALARQYWNAWGEAMRRGLPGAHADAAGVPGWQDAIDWWSQLAHGGRTEANAAVERFNAQARSWFGQMQQLTAQFAGQPAGAADIAAEWKRALGAIGDNPFPELFRAMRGRGAQGLEQWIEDATPYLEAMRREAGSWLGLPAFGLGREHQERRQQLLQAQLDYQQRNAAYNALMFKALQRAFEVFESKLAEHEEPGRQLSSARALFDLWIDAAEEAYAGIALSPEFREVYGALANAQMRLRQGVQREVEQAGALLGMPTRSEVDAAHRKIAELERVVRRLRAAAADPQASAAAQAAGRGRRADSSGSGGESAVAAVAPPAGRADAKPASRAGAKSASRADAKPASRTGARSANHADAKPAGHARATPAAASAATGAARKVTAKKASAKKVPATKTPSKRTPR